MDAAAFSLQGRTALVTGAASGIGRAIALSFAKAGASVAINHWGRDAEATAVRDEAASLGATAMVIEADVTRPYPVDSMVRSVVFSLGPIDILVNCAGIIQEKPFLDTTLADWDRMIATDLTAREFAPHIRVNSIAPGPVETAMLSSAHMSAEWLAKEMDIPQNRLAQPEEIADTALFLASDLSRFYCGQVLGPNGGSVMP